MQLDEKAHWNQKYSEGLHTSLEPDPFLVSTYDEFLSNRSPGTLWTLPAARAAMLFG